MRHSEEANHYLIFILESAAYVTESIILSTSGQDEAYTKTQLRENSMENYIDAAESRFDDLNAFIKEERKVGSIHLGGIYIECLLKGMICMEHSVGDGPGSHKWIVDGLEMTRPGHVLHSPELVTLLDPLYDDMPDNILNALDYIAKPEGINYIDYRYIPEDNINMAIYDYWMEQFISVFNYLDQKKHEI